MKVGLLYNPALEDFLSQHKYVCDYIEVIPDMLWTDEGKNKTPRFNLVPSWRNTLDKLASSYDLVAHNIGFSLGTAEHFDFEYLENLNRIHEKYNFLWHSDHISFVKLEVDDNFDHNTGMAIPIPYDEEMLHLISSKLKTIKSNLDSDFLVENNVFFIDIPEQDMTEEKFLNQLCMDSGCNLLLDLHNIYANSINFKFDPFDFISKINCTQVKEIHIAGGNMLGDMYTDSHAGPCPKEVYKLLEYTIPRCPNLNGVTFEFHDSYFHLLQFDGMFKEIEQMRTIINKFQPCL